MRNLNSKIFKVIGIFSGAEAFSILCSIVKMKLVSIWLGAVGVGLFGIFTNAIDTISIITGLGLRQSGVREIATANKTTEKLSHAAAMVRTWSMLGGLIGATVINFLSPWLSYIFFGDYSHWWQFMILSGALLFNSIIGGEQAILQGTEKFKGIARSSVTGSFIGLAVSIPLFRFVSESLSIPLSFLAYSLAIASALWLNRNPKAGKGFLPLDKIKEGSQMVKFGGYMALAAFATNLAQMIFLSWMNRTTSTYDVGLYQAGNTLVVRYTSIIFTAVGLEFFPRMTANNHSSHRMSLFTSHEIGLLLKIFTPMVIVFILCRRLIVEILYSSEFYEILPFITIAIGAIILRAISSCMAFSIIARGDGKIYLLTEGIDAIVGVTLNITMFKVLGFTGLGIAQVLWYLVYTLITGAVYRFRYGLWLSKPTLKGITLSIVISAAAIITATIFLNPQFP